MKKRFIQIVLFVLIPLSISTAHAHEGVYQAHNLVSDGFLAADHTDPDMVNPWGIAFNPNGPVWISNAETGLSTIYNGMGIKSNLIVIIPPSSSSPAGTTGSPTGIVFNTTKDFPIAITGTGAVPSAFIFSTEDGTISAWEFSVDKTHAVLMADNSRSNASYKGLALAANGTDHFLYATDFHNSKIDVFDKNFKLIRLPGGFTDTSIPKDYAPFGISNINGDLYVTYAKQDADKHDDVAGQGNGFVNVFDANGYRIKRFATRGQLNSPWGLAFAPSDFGKFSNDLLIGNFGDGRINAYDIATGTFKGTLKKADDHVLVIEGLWGLSFGNGVLNQPTKNLYFTAGSDHEAHGTYGFIVPASNKK